MFHCQIVILCYEILFGIELVNQLQVNINRAAQLAGNGRERERGKERDGDGDGAKKSGQH